jgi:transcriptional regulator with XRE-family HTH domain
MTKLRHFSPHTLDALALLGTTIATRRRARRMPMAELAVRVGTSVPTLRKIERGDPTVAIGIMFETATILGLDLFEDDNYRTRHLLERQRDRLALLPQRIRDQVEPYDDNF